MHPQHSLNQNNTSALNKYFNVPSTSPVEKPGSAQFAKCAKFLMVALGSLEA